MKAPATPSNTPRPTPDLDSTAELPVLDPAEAEAEPGEADDAIDAVHAATDTWILPPGARVAAAQRPGAGAPLPAGGTAGGPELRELEANLQTALAKLRDADQLAARQLEQLHELEASRAQAQAAHRAAEVSAASLRAELTQREAAAARHATDLEGAHRATAEAEQRTSGVSDELTRAREKSSSLSEQLTELQQRLEQQQVLSSGELVREREQQQALTAQAHAHSARLIQDLHLERARSASCLESLQTLESRRQIAESATIDLHREMDMWQSTEAELRGRLGGRDGRVRELETELDRRAAQIGALERQISALEAKLTEREAQVRDAHHEVQAQQANVARLQQEALAGTEHGRELEARIAQHEAGEGQRQEELQRLRTQRAELDVMLAAERDATAAQRTETAAREAAFASERARNTELETALAAERQRVADLEGEVTTMTGEMQTWTGVLKNAQQERNAQLDGIQAAADRVHSLEQDLEKQRVIAQQLQAESDARAARVAELEGELRTATDNVQRLEAEAGSHVARIEALEKANEQWRTTAAVGRDSGSRRRGSARAAARQPDATAPARSEARHPVMSEELSEEPSHEEIVYESVLHPDRSEPSEQLSGRSNHHAEPAEDGVARVLIESDGEREVVHVLGRKTSIGRTPDNDVQIDGRHISRHHAVILAGPTDTLIEDLNSTNGVLVNGRRVVRQVLQDGDQVTIGRTLYRFALRPADEPR